MGSQLSLPARLIGSVAIACAATAAWAGPSAEDLVKQGATAFKAGDYEAAIKLLGQAYAIEGKPDTLFALAQAERLGGYCDRAIPHYKQVLQGMTDLEKSKLVQSNLSLCENLVGSKPPNVIEPPKVEPPPPTIEPPPPTVRTVLKVERRTDLLATAALATGALGLGAGIGLHLAANGSREDAGDARTLEDNQRLNDRADAQRVLSIAALGAGGGLIGFAIFRWVSHRDEPAATVSVIPAASAAVVAVRARW